MELGKASTSEISHLSPRLGSRTRDCNVSMRSAVGTCEAEQASMCRKGFQGSTSRIQSLPDVADPAAGGGSGLASGTWLGGACFRAKLLSTAWPPGLVKIHNLQLPRKDGLPEL